MRPHLDKSRHKTTFFERKDLKEIHQNNSQKIPAGSRAFKSTLSSPDGNVLRVLKGEMPKIARAEAKAKAKRGWELIYKRGATLNGNYPSKLYLGPLALLSLDPPSLTSPCYSIAIIALGISLRFFARTRSKE